MEILQDFVQYLNDVTHSVLKGNTAFLMVIIVVQTITNFSVSIVPAGSEDSLNLPTCHFNRAMTSNRVIGLG